MHHKTRYAVFVTDLAPAVITASDILTQADTDTQLTD